MNRIFGQKKVQAPMPTLGKEKREEGREGGEGERSRGGHDVGRSSPVVLAGPRASCDPCASP